MLSCLPLSEIRDFQHIVWPLTADEERAITLLHEIRHCGQGEKDVFDLESDANWRAIEVLERKTPGITPRILIARSVAQAPTHDDALYIDAKMQGVMPPSLMQRLYAAVVTADMIDGLFVHAMQDTALIRNKNVLKKLNKGAKAARVMDEYAHRRMILAFNALAAIDTSRRLPRVDLAKAPIVKDSLDGIPPRLRGPEAAETLRKLSR